MSIEDILQNAPRYEDVVTAYGLDVRGGDLQLTASGSIAVTVDGCDLKWGNDRVNAMHRLIQRWCFNAPTLVGLFKLVGHARATKEQLGEEMNMIAPIAFGSTQSAERFHEINNEVGAYTFGGAACAGAIMVVLHNLLMRFKVDLNASKEKWEKSSPQIGGCSLGSIVAAGAANFRHHDEWARSNPPPAPSHRPLRSAEDYYIAPVLSGSRITPRDRAVPMLLLRPNVSRAVKSGAHQCVRTRCSSRNVPTKSGSYLR